MLPTRPIQNDDAEAMKSLQSGDDSALSILMKKYQGDVYRYAYSFLWNREEAEEMAQESFLRVFEKRESFDSDRPFKPWLLTIVRNQCKNILKRRTIVQFTSIEGSERDSRQVESRIPAERAAPCDPVLENERTGILFRLVDQLPPKDRELLELRYFKKIRAKEIAKIIGSTDGAVRARLFRIMRTLRCMASEEDYFKSDEPEASKR